MSVGFARRQYSLFINNDKYVNLQSYVSARHPIGGDSISLAHVLTSTGIASNNAGSSVMQMRIPVVRYLYWRERNLN